MSSALTVRRYVDLYSIILRLYSLLISIIDIQATKKKRKRIIEKSKRRKRVKQVGDETFVPSFS